LDNVGVAVPPGAGRRCRSDAVCLHAVLGDKVVGSRGSGGRGGSGERDFGRVGAFGAGLRQ
jgi:hypothetical protein